MTAYRDRLQAGHYQAKPKATAPKRWRGVEATLHVDGEKIAEVVHKPKRTRKRSKPS